MATLLDFGLGSFFSSAFSFLLVFVLLFAILSKFKVVSDKQGINALIAFAVAMLFLFTPGVSKILTLSAPWFVLMIFLIFVIMMMSMFMGAKEADIAKVLSEDGVGYWIVIISILIIVGAVGFVYRPQILAITSPTGEITQASSNDWLTNIGVVLFNPKVLGLVLILIIASLTIGRLAAYNK